MQRSPSTQRRRLLQLAAATASAAWLARSAWSQPRLGSDPFTLGVASGSPTATAVVLWTRLLGDAIGREPITVRWEIADDEAFTRILQSGQAQALRELAHSVHVEAQGLEPDRWYFYRFLAGPWASPVGRTRTFPAADAPAQRLRLAYASCQRWEHGWFGAYRHMRADAPDAVVFLGDYIYEYPAAASPVRPPPGRWALDLDQYRARYALYKGDPDLQAMHRACPWLFTWDDHEVQNDYAGEQAGQAGPSVSDFRGRRAAAYQAWYEHMPVPASVLARALQGLASGHGLRIHRQQRFGQLAQLLLLDSRQHRSPQACTAGGRTGSAVVNPLQCASLADPARTMLGAEQEAWLQQELARGGAAWTVLGQSTLFGPRDFAPGPGALLWNDGWDGYPAARRRLLAALQHGGVRNAVLLGGDVHENWVGHVKAHYERPDSASVGVEFCGTSISSRPNSPDHTGVRLAENPHFVFADAVHRGYGIADFTRQRLEVSLRGMDDVTRKDSGASTLARFVVEAGRAVVNRA
jgi:alkaline phosphatase D